MNGMQRRSGVCAALILVTLGGTAGGAGQGQPPATAPTAAARVCGTMAFCAEELTFAAAITDFQAILQNQNSKTLTVRLRVKNKLNRLLALGYVTGSGIATDERGNRYAVSDQTVQGVGLIRGTAADPKFLLQPGETSDARFEFVWNTSGQEIFGVTFQIDLALREIDPLPGGQIRLGREHALHYAGLTNRATAAAPRPAPGPAPVAPASPSAGAAAPPGAPPAAPPAILTDACAGRPRCYSAGIFAADVTSVVPSFGMTGWLQMLQVRVRFKNATNQPLMLGYVGNSGVATDAYGGRYTISQTGAGDGVKGIGLVQRGEADSQFVLAPGATGDAVFTLSRHRAQDKRDPIGTEFNFDLSAALLEVLPSRQIRTVREYAIGFTGLTASVATTAAPSPDSCGAKPKCYGTPAFTSEITGLTASFAMNQGLHVLQAKVRFTNVTDRPLILAYLAGSALIVDNFGGRYFISQPGIGDGVKGMGVLKRNEADTSFVLKPGMTGDAIFSLSRHRGNDRSDPIGKTFQFEAAVAELEVLPSQQINTVREYAIGVPNLAASGASLLDKLIKPPKGAGQ